MRACRCFFLSFLPYFGPILAPVAIVRLQARGTGKCLLGSISLYFFNGYIPLIQNQEGVDVYVAWHFQNGRLFPRWPPGHPLSI